MTVKIKNLLGKVIYTHPGANLSGADLSGADLSGADLYGAYLYGANLFGAHLSGADLSRSNLSGANLSRSNLSGANLSGANFSGANLSGANLSGANLSGANLSGATLPHFQICPERGSFLAYKKLQNGLALLRIPAGVARTSSLVGRKCRAERVLVVGLKLTDGSCVGVGCYDRTKYVKGATVVADSWDGDIRVECTHGIHFSLTKREALEYVG